MNLDEDKDRWASFSLIHVNHMLLRLGQLLFDSFHSVTIRENLADAWVCSNPAPPARQFLVPVANKIAEVCLHAKERGGVAAQSAERARV